MTNHPERRLIRDYPLPAKLYKFTKKEFAKPILTGQSIRIGTLREFTKTEERQLNKGDRNEGTVNVAGGKFTISSDSSPGLHKFLSAAIRGEHIRAGLASTPATERHDDLELRVVMF